MWSAESLPDIFERVVIEIVLQVCLLNEKLGSGYGLFCTREVWIVKNISI